jgi:glutathione S-transferase
MLERERAARSTSWLFGNQLSHADIMLGAAIRFLHDAHPGRFDLDRHTALRWHSDRCEALPEFQNSYQAFRLG